MSLRHLRIDSKQRDSTNLPLSHSPLALFIVQAFIIVAFSRILHLGLRYARQPRVISEIVAGILLGPTAFGEPLLSIYVASTATGRDEAYLNAV